MMKKVILILAVAILSNGALEKAYGASKEQLFSLANLSFANGSYNEAIEGYIKIIKKGLRNPDVYYNLGNAYVKTGDAGRAILSYERALELAPGNEDVAYNLSLVRKQISAEDVETGYGDLLPGIITLNKCVNMLVFFYFLIFAALIGRMISDDDNRKKKMLKSIYAFTFITLFLGVIAAIEIYNQEGANYGIVVSEEAPVYEVPMEKGEAIASMPAGAKLKVLDRDADWLKIATPGGAVGWVKGATTGLI